MKVILVGEGKELDLISRDFTKKNYVVNVVNKNFGLTNDCDLDDQLQNELIEAGIKDADIIMALTLRDSYNLAICQIAKLDYGIDRTYAKVNNADNAAVFKSLDVTDVINMPEIIFNLVQ